MTLFELKSVVFDVRQPAKRVVFFNFMCNSDNIKIGQ